MQQSELDDWHMDRALALAALGQGSVEPNPLVGCVIAQGAEIIGEGWHRRFGGSHAEVDALAVAGPRARGSTLYVTLEPCCHHGKTPPCTQAIIAAGIHRVVLALRDPFPQVDGGGIVELKAAGIAVETSVREAAAQRLNAPYLKLLATGRPWIIAKWAMTLDGKIATRTGDSRWISGAESRAVVHVLRGRVDAIVVGRETAAHDDPLLTARPPGPRMATRVVFDSRASLSSKSQLAQTARDVPVLVAVGPEASEEDLDRLRNTGCEVLRALGTSPAERLNQLVYELGRRRMTNILVEGGGKLLGTFFDSGLIDEVHVFVAPKLIGGQESPSPIGALGLASIADAATLIDRRTEMLGDDMYISGRLHRSGMS